jgi:hypothetical protein
MIALRKSVVMENGEVEIGVVGRLRPNDSWRGEAEDRGCKN